MLTRPPGQELLDGFSAVSLGASALVVARWGPASMLRSRLRFAFGALCFFFAARAATGATGSPGLNLLTLLIACTTPLTGLLLAEGVLRRHAPRLLKAFVTFGAIPIAMALIFSNGQAPASNWGLGTFVVLSLASVTMLLLLRDRKSLSRQENASVDALAVPGAVVTVLTVSDFLTQAPVGLSGVGVTMVAFVLGANPSSRREAQSVLADLLVMGVVAVLSELALASVLGLRTAAEQVRMGATLIALLLATAALLRARHAEARQAVHGFAHALTQADTTSLNGFLNSLTDQPLLAGLRLAEGAQLAEYDQDSLGTTFSARAVWTPDALGDAQTPGTVRGHEELSDLMTRTESTHAVMLSRTPLRIALLTLPGGGEAADAETDLALFGKLAVTAATERACV